MVLKTINFKPRKFVRAAAPVATIKAKKITKCLSFPNKNKSVELTPTFKVNDMRYKATYGRMLDFRDLSDLNVHFLFIMYPKTEPEIKPKALDTEGIKPII